MDEAIDVTVKVPAARLSELYAIVGRWWGEDSQSVNDQEPDGTTSDTAETWWRENDERLAREVWAKLSPRAENLLALLMETPGQKVQAADLAARLGIVDGDVKHAIAGILAWPGRYCTAVGRDAFWSWRYVSDGGGAEYWMEPEIAELLKSIRR